MKRANMGDAFTGKGGLLQPASLRTLLGIMGYFGNVLGGKLNKFLYGFERVVKNMRDNWDRVTEEFMLVFTTGILLLKGAIAAQIGRMAAGGIVGLAAGGVKAGGKLGAIWKKRPGQGGKGPYAEYANAMQNIQYVMSKVLNPAMWALAAVSTTVGVMVAGMAAYLIQNWKKIIKSILDNWGLISQKFTDVYVSAMKLWNALVIVGEAFLGGMASANGLSTALGILDSVIWGVSKAVQAVVLGVKYLNIFIAFFQEMIGGLFQGLGFLVQKIPTMEEFGQNLSAMGSAYQEAARENITDAQKMSTASAMIDSELRRQATKRELAEAKKLEEKIKSRLRDKTKGKKTPTSGVHITNQYNQWDLRNTDPDRIMSAFVPKLEQMADQRTQSYEALDQGV
jgi:hypothetical protein